MPGRGRPPGAPLALDVSRELRGLADLLSPLELGPGECHCAPENTHTHTHTRARLGSVTVPLRTHTHTHTCLCEASLHHTSAVLVYFRVSHCAPENTHTHTHTHTHPLRGSSAPHFSGPGVLQSIPDSLHYSKQPPSPCFTLAADI